MKGLVLLLMYKKVGKSRCNFFWSSKFVRQVIYQIGRVLSTIVHTYSKYFKKEGPFDQRSFDFGSPLAKGPLEKALSERFLFPKIPLP